MFPALDASPPDAGLPPAPAIGGGGGLLGLADEDIMSDPVLWESIGGRSMSLSGCDSDSELDSLADPLSEDPLSAVRSGNFSGEFDGV